MGRQAHHAIAEIDDPLDRLEALWACGASGLRRMSLRFSQDVERQPSAQRLFADHYRYAEALIEEIVQEAIDTGRARQCDAHFVAEAINAIIVRLHEPDYRHRSSLTVEQSLYEAQRFVRAALEVPDRVRRHPNRDVVRIPARASTTTRRRTRGTST
jgi:hypothetical protein